MRFQEIQKMATTMGIPAYRVKKTELIRAIQRTEGNIECYGTDRLDHCDEQECLWRMDCKARHNRP